MNTEDLQYQPPPDFPIQAYQMKYYDMLKQWAHVCGDLLLADDLDGLEWLSNQFNLLTLDTLDKILKQRGTQYI